MPSSSTAHPGPRRYRLNRAVLATLATAALIPGAATASTMVWTSNITSQMAGDPWVYNVGSLCQVTGGSSCGGPAKNQGVIFGWGTLADSGSNSVFDYTHSGPTFNLETITLDTITNPSYPIGAGLYNNGTEGFTQGTGAAPAWEWDSNASKTKISEARVQIKIEFTGGSVLTATKALFTGYGADETWYTVGSNVTLPTPVDFSAGISDFLDEFNNPVTQIQIEAGDYISIRLFESSVNASQTTPDVVYSAMNVGLNEAPAPAPLPPSLVLMLPGLLLLLRRRRV